MAEPLQLVYAHDPMCSWCWGFRATFQQVTEALPENIQVKRMLGGLAADTDEPMPLAMQQRIQQAWRRIQETIPGTEFNFDFWQTCIPRRSTYASCRAVLAARTFAVSKDAEMTYAIQQAYYMRAMNPSDNSTLIQLAVEIGLPEKPFTDLLLSDDIEQQLQTEISQTRALGVDSYPSLVLCLPGGLDWPISIHYTQPNSILKQIEDML